MENSVPVPQQPPAALTDGKPSVPSLVTQQLASNPTPSSSTSSPSISASYGDPPNTVGKRQDRESIAGSPLTAGSPGSIPHHGSAAGRRASHTAAAAAGGRGSRSGTSILEGSAVASPGSFTPMTGGGGSTTSHIIGGRRPSSGATPDGRRGSGTYMTPSGQTVAYHTRRNDETDFPHAEKKTMADHLRKYEALFTLSPQRMRMIVDAFEETLDKGLQKHGEIVPMSESQPIERAQKARYVFFFG